MKKYFRMLGIMTAAMMLMQGTLTASAVESERDDAINLPLCAEKKQVVCIDEVTMPVSITAVNSEGNTDTSVLDDASTEYGFEAFGKYENGEGLTGFYTELENLCKAFWNNSADIAYTEGIGYLYGKVSYSEYSLTFEDAIAVYYMLRNDNPLLYFISERVLYDNVGNIYLVADASYSSGTYRAELKNEILAELEEYGSVIDSNASIYSNVKAVHDKINTTIEYAFEDDGVTAEDAAWAHNIIGCMTDEAHKGVCECYARSFSLILNYYDIENITVTGTANGGGHAWNMVKLDDGEYYYVDCTWDDSTRSYSYFAVGSDYFDQTHTADTPEGTLTSYLYALPEASTSNYEMMLELLYNDTSVGKFASVNDAFKEMTDAEGIYKIVLTEKNDYEIAGGEWPAVKEICFACGIENSYSSVRIKGDVALNSDLRLCNIGCATQYEVLVKNDYSCAEMNIGSNAVYFEGDYAYMGLSYTEFIGEQVNLVSKTGPNITGNDDSALYINVNDGKSVEFANEYTRVGNVYLDRDILAREGEFTADNVYSDYSTGAFRIYAEEKNHVDLTVKNYHVESVWGENLYAQSITSDSSICIENITYDDTENEIKDFTCFGIYVRCEDGSYSDKISVMQSDISLRLTVENSETIYVSSGGSDFTDKEQYIWDGIYDYNGTLINIGNIPLEDLKVEFIVSVLENEEIKEYFRNNIELLCEKDTDGNVYKAYDERFAAEDGVLKKYAAFSRNMTSLVEVPSYVTSIEDGVFSYYASFFNELYIPETVTDISANVFANTDTSALTIYGWKNSCAETFALENSINFAALDDIVLTDENTGISVISAGGFLKSSYVLSVQDTEITNDISSQVSNAVKAYELAVFDGTENAFVNGNLKISVSAEKEDTIYICDENGKYILTASQYNEETGMLEFEASAPCSFVIAEAMPTVSSGDYDGDGSINNKDLTLLRRQLADNSSTAPESADINDDGVVNNKDLALLRRKLAGYEI